MTTETSTAGRKPTCRLYRVTGEGENAIWTPIGAAWRNRDSKGYSIQLDAVPLDGRIIMRAIAEKPKESH